MFGFRGQGLNDMLFSHLFINSLYINMITESKQFNLVNKRLSMLHALMILIAKPFHCTKLTF